jgi:hypothetical protein
VTAARLGSAAVAVAVLMAVAGCGSARAPGQGSVTPSAAGIAGPALATSLSAGDGTSWAVLPMGGSAASENEFWELFVQPASESGWQLVTPPGVASNGGLVAALTGTGTLVTGFRPSQDLTFSPLAVTADAGRSWDQGAVLSPGLADLPTAMTAGPLGNLLALTDGGDVEEGTALGASWSRLTTLRALSHVPAVRAGCTLTALTAAAWTPSGQPLLGGSCAPPGRPSAGTAQAAIITLSAGAWHLADLVLPPAVARDPVTVLGLATSGTGTTAILAVGSGASTGVMAAWSATGDSGWTLSPVLRTGPGGSPAISLWADGSAGLVLGSRAATIGWRAGRWSELPGAPTACPRSRARPPGRRHWPGPRLAFRSFSR